MRGIIQQLATRWQSSRKWFGPKREASPTREMELHAAARRERQRRENRIESS
jgi:hypothetical protein